MISAADRAQAIQLIDESVASGARRYRACQVLNISDRTYCRWVELYRTHGSYEDLRPGADRPEPANKLTPEERQRIVEVMTQP